MHVNFIEKFEALSPDDLDSSLTLGSSQTSYDDFIYMEDSPNYPFWRPLLLFTQERIPVSSKHGSPVCTNQGPTIAGAKGGRGKSFPFPFTQGTHMSHTYKSIYFELA